MTFDALTLAAVRDELAPRLSGARMQKIVFVDELSLAIEFFAPGVGRTNVLLSAHLEQARVHAIRQLPARGIERDSPFDLLVRKHLRHARVRSIRQPRLERVFELECEQRDPSDRPYRVVVIVEAMGRRSNLLLVDGEGLILDAARRTPPSRNARRPVLPHLPYAPPPPQDRLMPEDVTAESLSTGAGGPLDRWLAQRVAGLSPGAAREIVFRATSNAHTMVEGVDWARLAAETRAFLALADTHAWSPCVAFDVEGRALDYAPYALTHLEDAGARLEGAESISEAIQAYYAASERAGFAPRGDPLAAERKALIAPLDRAMRTADRRVAALEHQLNIGQSDREPLRRAGDLILAHLTEIGLEATEFAVEGERVELDPRLSAIENAQSYFALYRRARETEERVPRLLAEARHASEHLADLRTLVEVAGHMDAIRALRREVASATSGRPSTDAEGSKDGKARSGKRGTGRAGDRGSKAAAPYRRVALSNGDGDGWEALIGTSAVGNATVTFDVARGEDLWLHARGVAGAHVVLRSMTASGEPPTGVVERAAELAAGHSASRGAGAVEVDVTQRRYVKKIPGGPPGLVRYANERTLRVTPRA
jgi:predicted ribosome quality control (RQC) complex YloA/Tae2 family protein